MRKEQANSVSCLHVNRSLSASFHSATADSEMKRMRNWAGTAEADKMHSLSVRKILIEGTQKHCIRTQGRTRFTSSVRVVLSTKYLCVHWNTQMLCTKNQANCIRNAPCQCPAYLTQCFCCHFQSEVFPRHSEGTLLVKFTLKEIDFTLPRIPNQKNLFTSDWNI